MSNGNDDGNGIIPNPGSAVLYPAASGLEQAMADADAVRLMEVDAEAIIDIWDPIACPLMLLPYLAWAMGVTFWNDQWSETTKRSWIALQWTFKSLRGTREGIAMAIDYAGRDVSPYGYWVNQFVAQPQKCFPGAAVSAADREAWLASLPQVRVYYYQDTGTFPAVAMFVGAFMGPDPAVEKFPFVSTAASRLGRRATWNVGGVDTDVPVDDFGSYFRLHFPGVVGVGAFVGLCLGGGIVMSGRYTATIPSMAWKRLVTIAPQAVSPYPVAIGPSLMAVTSQPTQVAVTGTQGRGAFAGSNYVHGAGMFLSPAGGVPIAAPNIPAQPPVFPTFLIPSTAKYRLYDRYAVYIGDDAPPQSSGPATMFIGIGRLGFPPFTAEVDASITSSDCPAKFRVGDVLGLGKSFTIPHDPGPVAYACSAIEAARRLVDLTYLWAGPQYVFVAGSPFIAGQDSFVIGQAQIAH